MKKLFFPVFLLAAAFAFAQSTIVPPVPHNLRAESPVTDCVTLKWDNAGDDVTYRLYIDTQNLPSRATVYGGQANGTSLLVENLIGGSEYFFWVASLRDGQESEKSPVVSIRTPSSYTTSVGVSDPKNVIGSSSWRQMKGSSDGTVKINVEKEILGGVEKDVLTMEISFPHGTSGNSNTGINTDGIKFRNGSGIRFKTLGDGRLWYVALLTKNVKGENTWYRWKIRPKKGKVLDINIPYSKFIFGSGAKVRFDKKSITDLQFYRDWDEQYGTSTLKVFDFEIIP